MYDARAVPKRIIVPEKFIKIINIDCYGDSWKLGIKRSTPWNGEVNETFTKKPPGGLLLLIR